MSAAAVVYQHGILLLRLLYTSFFPDVSARPGRYLLGGDFRHILYICFVLLLLSCVLLFTFCRMPRLDTVNFNIIRNIFLFVPAALCCALLCSLDLLVLRLLLVLLLAVYWQVVRWLGSAWPRPLCSSCNLNDVQTSSYIMHVYVKKSICACCAAVDQSKSEIATRT